MSGAQEPGDAPRIRLAIVDDHPLVGQGVAALLAREPDLEIVGLATSLAEAAALLESAAPPDVLLLDVKLGEESGLDLLSRVRSSSTAVIVLTAYDYGPYLAAAHRLGAAGFVVKTAPLGTLVDAIRRVAVGGLVFDRRPTEVVTLTPRERSVVTLLLDGQTNDEIASGLGITTRTVEAHLSRLFERLGIGSRTELATRALREGWLDVPPARKR
ncbi:MAG: response regulator transcription factor [Chloroflexota bacterium]